MIIAQAVREREMSTNREISGIDNVSAYTSRYFQIQVIGIEKYLVLSLISIFNVQSKYGFDNVF